MTAITLGSLPTIAAILTDDPLALLDQSLEQILLKDGLLPQLSAQLLEFDVLVVVDVLSAENGDLCRRWYLHL